MSRDRFDFTGEPRRPAPARRRASHADPLAPQPGPTPDEACSVTQLNALVKATLEEMLPPLWVSGEVTGWKRYRGSGHCYFALRDELAQVRAVMFRSDAGRLPTDPEEGMRVRVLAAATLYERRGDFQLVVRQLEAEGGDGLWRLAFERLRGKLDAEGLLAPERKRALPAHPVCVGVVTSPVGAALQDILNILARRAPWTRVVLSPARVQGDGAAAEVAAALGRLDAAGVADVIIVGRGGGSMEDLWAFNEEPVARAIAACTVPVISAVGHETDVTIADLVADLRAPTPSAAAEYAVPDGAELRRGLRLTEERLRGALVSTVAAAREQVEGWNVALEDAVQYRLEAARERLKGSAALLEALSPLAALGRGYAVPRGRDGRVLRSAADFAPGMPFQLRVRDGELPCVRTEEESHGTS
ncbi:MAG: exodeoxyribonuclease VII large subunit [Gemmatimonadota bacterium]